MKAQNLKKNARNLPGRRQTNGRRDAEVEQEYLAAELGHWLDDDGEPVGLEFPGLRQDPKFREFFQSIFQQFQTTRALHKHARDMEREGLTSEEIWAPGLTELLPTNCTAEQLRRYKQKLLFRANFLEAILTETVAELKRLERLQPRAVEEKAR